MRSRFMGGVGGEGGATIGLYNPGRRRVAADRDPRAMHRARRARGRQSLVAQPSDIFRFPRLCRSTWLPLTAPSSCSPPSPSTRATPTSSRTRCVHPSDLRTLRSTPFSSVSPHRTISRKSKVASLQLRFPHSVPPLAVANSRLSSPSPRLQISDGVLDACLAQDPDAKVRARSRPRHNRASERSDPTRLSDRREN